VLVPGASGFRTTIPLCADPSGGAEARIADEDTEDAVRYAMTIVEQDDDTRLHLGPARDAALPEA
jgi:hypothetical protein